MAPSALKPHETHTGNCYCGSLTCTLFRLQRQHNFNGRALLNSWNAAKLRFGIKSTVVYDDFLYM